MRMARLRQIIVKKSIRVVNDSLTITAATGGLKSRVSNLGRLKFFGAQNSHGWP
jgi:hypothetical protein